jgi:small subunit ribosomal protein S6
MGHSSGSLGLLRSAGLVPGGSDTRAIADAMPSCHGWTVADQPVGGVERMRTYEVMVILDPDLEERTVAPSLETFLNVVRNNGGTVEKLDIWGRRRMSYDINKKSDGIYALATMNCTPAAVAELDRQLNLNEAVLRTKVMRTDKK